MSKIKDPPQPKAKPLPRVVNLLDLTPASIDDPNTLLGNRFLCRGGGGEIVGSTGIGKSTLLMQGAVHWAIGRECFGIKPAGALKVLMVQAENDEGDLCEMRDGALESLGELSNKERALLQKNFVCVFESCRTGEELIDALSTLLAEHSPDLLAIDPANAYIGGDGGKQEIVGPFLRNGLNPLLQQHRCGALLVHHTNKPRAEGNGQRVATDAAYAGAGSAEWANWSRCVLVLSSKNDDGLCELRIGKRFRLGWKDASGNPTKVKFLKQNLEGGSLFFQELPPEESIMVSSTASAFDKVIRSDFLLPGEGKSMDKQELIARIAGAKPKICGLNVARNAVLPLLIGDGYLEEIRIPRPTGPPAVHLVRTAKRHNVILMEAAA